MPLHFTIRDLLWLTLVAAVAAACWGPFQHRAAYGAMLIVAIIATIFAWRQPNRSRR